MKNCTHQRCAEFSPGGSPLAKPEDEDPGLTVNLFAFYEYPFRIGAEFYCFTNFAVWLSEALLTSTA